MSLKTDYRDDIFGGSRRHLISQNEDGTVNIADVTTYTQKGDRFGANDLNAICTEVNETKKSVGDGKTKIAAAITRKKVTTAAAATFDTMAGNIDKIKLGSGNATPDKVLQGATFTGDSGVEQVGTMPNMSTALHGGTGENAFNESVIISAQSNNYVTGLDYMIPNGLACVTKMGVHDNSIRIHIANLLAKNVKHEVKIGGKNGYIQGTYTSDATITADKILNGYKGYSKGAAVSGSMPNQPAWIFVTDVAADPDNLKLNIYIDKGAYLVQEASHANRHPLQVKFSKLAGSLALTADKLKQGISVCGVDGNFTGDATITADKVLSGYKGYSKGVAVSGSIPVNLAVIDATNVEYADPSKELRVRFPQGYYPLELYGGNYHNPYVKAPYSSVASALRITPNKIASGQSVCGVDGNFTGDATLTADKVLSGYKGYSKGVAVTGNMPNRGTAGADLSEITPPFMYNGELVQYIPYGHYGIGNTTFKEPCFRGIIPEGKIATALLISPDKIVSGRIICGVVGTAQLRVAAIANTQTLTSAANSAAEKSKDYDVSAYAGYQNFTTENFNLEITNSSHKNTTDQYISGMDTSIGKRYNAATGVLTVAIKNNFTQWTSTIKYNLKLMYVG